MYARFQATAHRLLSRYGKPREIIFSYLPPGTGKSWEPSQEDQEDIPVEGVVLPANTKTLEGLDDRVVPGTLTDFNVRMLVLSAKTSNGNPLPPMKVGDRFLFDEEEWSVIGVTPVSPGGIPIVYRVAVRR